MDYLIFIDKAQPINVKEFRQYLNKTTALTKDFSKGEEYLEILAKAHKADGKTPEFVNTHLEAMIWLCRRGGEIIKGDERIHQGQPKKETSHHERILLSDYDIDRNQSNRWQLMAALPEDKCEEILSAIKNKKEAITKKAVLSAAKRHLREQAYGKDIKRYGTINIYNVGAFEFLKWHDKHSVDLLITDPPYMTDVEDIDKFADSWLPLALSKVKYEGHAYVFTGAYPAELKAYLNAINDRCGKHLVFDNVLVWTYRNTIGPATKMGYKLNWQACFYLYGQRANPLLTDSLKELFTVQDINAPDARTGVRLHEWQKPDELAERLIRHSTKEGDLVIDPFCGTGTFLAAASKLGRNSQGADINEDMLKLCEKRGLKWHRKK